MDHNQTLLAREDGDDVEATPQYKRQGSKLFGFGQKASSASQPAKYQTLSKGDDGTDHSDDDKDNHSHGDPPHSPSVSSSTGSMDGDGYITTNLAPHGYSDKQRNDKTSSPQQKMLDLPVSEAGSSHEEGGGGAGWALLGAGRGYVPSSLDISTARSAFTEPIPPPQSDVRNWPKSCPVVHLDIANDFDLSGKRRFIRTAFFFYWFLIVTLAENAAATLVSAMTTPIGGNPFVLQVAFLGFTGGYFWFFFCHFYVIYLGLRFKHKALFWVYFFHTLIIMFLGIYMLLVSLSDIMVLSQPLQPGSPVPIPLDTVLPMALEAFSCALWFSVVVFAAYLIGSTYFWYTLPMDVERLMVEEEALQPSGFQGISAIASLFGGKKQAETNDVAAKEAQGMRAGGGFECELVIRPDSLQVPGTLLLSQTFLHFCSRHRVFDFQVTRITKVEDIQTISISNKQQLLVKAKNWTQKARFNFESPAHCRRAYKECSELWMVGGGANGGPEQWIWERSATHTQMLVDTDFVSDVSLLPKMKAHKNRARDRKFSSLPPALVEGEIEMSIPWELVGHEVGLHPLWGVFESHRLSGEDWLRLLGGTTTEIISANTPFLESSGEPNLWHIIEGEAEFRVENKPVAAARDNSILGVAPFLLWTLTKEEASHTQAVNDANNRYGLQHTHTETVNSRKKGDSGSGQTKAKSRWQWRVTSDKMKAYRLTKKWLSLALEQNPHLRGPFFRYIGQLLADRVESTDAMILEMAEAELNKPVDTKMRRLLDGSAIQHDETIGFAERAQLQDNFFRLFGLPSSDTLVHALSCVSLVEISSPEREAGEARGTLFISLHHLCFETSVTVVVKHKYSWKIAFDEVTDIMSTETGGVRVVLRDSRYVIAWGFESPATVVETLMIFWKDTDINMSFHPPSFLTVGGTQTLLSEAATRHAQQPVSLQQQVNTINNSVAPADADDTNEPLINLAESGGTPHQVMFGTNIGDVVSHDMGYRNISAIATTGTTSSNLPTQHDNDSDSEIQTRAPRHVRAPSHPQGMRGLQNILAQQRQKKKGYTNLEENSSEGESIDLGHVDSAAGAWGRLSLAEKRKLFAGVLSIGMTRNKVVLSPQTFQRPGLYLILDGIVRVQYMILNNTTRVLVQRLGQGCLFGVHSLLTCEPPQATFVVDSDKATVKHIPADKLAEVLQDAGDAFRGRFYRDLALSLCLSPSTVLYHNADSKWLALPY